MHRTIVVLYDCATGPTRGGFVTDDKCAPQCQSSIANGYLSPECLSCAPVLTKLDEFCSKHDLCIKHENYTFSNLRHTYSIEFNDRTDDCMLQGNPCRCDFEFLESLKNWSDSSECLQDNVCTFTTTILRTHLHYFLEMIIRHLEHIKNTCFFTGMYLESTFDGQRLFHLIMHCCCCGMLKGGLLLILSVVRTIWHGPYLRLNISIFQYCNTIITLS